MKDGPTGKEGVRTVNRVIIEGMESFFKGEEKRITSLSREIGPVKAYFKGEKCCSCGFEEVRDHERDYSDSKYLEDGDVLFRDVVEIEIEPRHAEGVDDG